MRKNLSLLLLVFLFFSSTFALSLNEIVRLSQNPSTLFKARQEVIKLTLSNPSSSAVLKVANRVYSKIKILESAKSTPEIHLAQTVIEENKDAFYSSLSSTSITTLPSDFALVFNVLNVVQDYSNFFSHISHGEYADAVKYFAKMRYLYKIPNISNFLPIEDTSSLWSFLAQGIKLNPKVFDEDGAKFLSSILTSYDIRTLYMKTYVWLSGLSVEQANSGLSVVEFESLISSFSKTKMDPNLLQWKYMTAKYLSFYTSISNAMRQLSTAKKLDVYLGYVPTFYRAIQDFPLQYKEVLSKEFSEYLDLLIQKISTTKVNTTKDVISDIRELATKYPKDPNSSKLMALTLNSNLNTKKVQKDETSSKQTEPLTSNEKKQSKYEFSSFYYYISIAVGFLIFFMLIPRMRLSFYRFLNLKNMEMGFYVKKLSKSPEDFRWHIKLANFYERIEKFEEAQREYQLAMKLMKTGGKGYEDSK